ncbi:divergent polysaccharide deacetylase family protein [Aliiglaciecola sp. M165]|uniref:divergent polysaccharide deacetylase family protein n=1 Tax=Aliiglaciecola sp. M165 TaxID=2593649 RepID=UPI0011810F7D|nr:divergent polysaccharide deacetylase family protein [Aliiglaciecola sp. M165]TRY31553.1 divergent polysaccharide deacetylase family protein [Aliiglaciecola sp. M165]
MRILPISILKKCLVTLSVLSFCWSSQAAEIALIIDDMGNTKRDAQAFELPAEVAFSILPMTHLSERFSRRAASQRREVMLHIPMESLGGNQLGPGALTADMSQAMLQQTLKQALATVPDAIGVNNHMGSKLTQLTYPMHATMDFLIQHELFFVDSRTTRYSKAESIARDYGVLSIKRNVFLDHDRRMEQIDAQFQRLIRLSKKYGFAVGIGHPYPQTIEYLKQALVDIESKGVQLSPISDLLRLQDMALNPSKMDPQKAELD